MAVSRQFFESLEDTDDVVFANGIKTKSAGKGVCCIQCPGPDGSVNTMTLNGTLFAPNLKANLFSVRSAFDDGDLEKKNLVTGIKIENCGVKAVCECCLLCIFCDGN